MECEQVYAMFHNDSVIDLYLTLESRDVVPAMVLATIAQSLPQVLNEFVAEYSDLETIEWGFTQLRVGSLGSALAPLYEMADDAAPKLRLVTDAFQLSTAAVQSGSDIVDVFPERASEPFQRMIKLLDRDVTSIKVGTASGSTTLTREGAGSHDRKKIRRQSLGTMTGIVQGVSFASTNPYFSLRQAHANRLIKCFFDEGDMAQGVIDSLRKPVTVHGLLIKDEFGVIQRINVARQLGNAPQQSRKVSIAELVGVAPDLTEGLPSEEWLRRKRDEK